ncbi:ion channel protein [Microbacterium hominis]|uniref:Ion channel protein n=1 Tax=Microbacterium hominis TaxID=162426 RepID=A0A7D4PUY8_9MICO|nr:ion channel protein [Microbacterium hominis]QKJ20093.1 ion channel protein [Microbacterium hominis]
MSDETHAGPPDPEPRGRLGGDVPAEASITRRLLLMTVPALLVGIGSALSLIVLDLLAEGLDSVLWEAIPAAGGFDPYTGWWVIVVLTAAGLATGLLVRFMPGHAGPDPATESFFPHPERLSTLPGIALAAVITLATGVSLGPEGPIIAINVAVAAWIFTKFLPAVPTKLVILMVVTGTFGALFGSPVGAALLATTVAATVASKELLWDRLFLPLASAASGSLVMMLLSDHTLAIDLPSYTPNVLLDLGIALAVCGVGIGVGAIMLWAFPHLHRIFHRWRNPILPLTVGGLLLGVLGAIGGEVTMFKGLEQMQQLAQEADDLSAGQVAIIVLIKVTALLIAAAAGFRGGRVFPTVFIGAAIGILAYALFPGTPLPVAVAAGVLGVCLIVVRDGWLSLFIAAVVAGDPAILPILCMVVLPGWLVVARLREMRVTAPEGGGAAVDAPRA